MIVERETEKNYSEHTKKPNGSDSDAVCNTVSLFDGVNGIAFVMRTVAEYDNLASKASVASSSDI